MYYNRKKLYSIVIIFQNVTVYLLNGTLMLTNTLPNVMINLILNWSHCAACLIITQQATDTESINHFRDNNCHGSRIYTV